MKILNSKGQPVLLNSMEKAVAENLQRQLAMNSLGADINITTLTTIIKRVSEQKLFEVAPADYLPIKVGEGAWSQQLTTFRSFNAADDFETGNVNTGTENGRLAQVKAGVDSISVPVMNWAKALGYTLFDLQFASKSNNWDMVTQLERARKKNWDLGIQRTAFLGSKSNSAVLGLLNQSGITTNSSLITTPISAMTTAQLKALTVGIIEAYRSNCNRTAWPTALIVPESDYNGLASTASPDFPIKSTLELLEESLKLITRNKSFKVLPLAYCDQAYNTADPTHQTYVLLNQDEESIRMDVPVDYTSTLANSIDNFSFQNVGYGQYTGVMAYRPKEMLYFKF